MSVSFFEGMPSCAGRHMSRKKKRQELGLKYKKMYWLTGIRSAMSAHNKLMLYKYCSLCGPTAYSCGDAGNSATLTPFNDFTTRYLGTTLMHLGISNTPTSIGTVKWRWLRMKLESSLRNMEIGFSFPRQRRSEPPARQQCKVPRLKRNKPFELV